VSDGGVSYGEPSFATLGDFSKWGRLLREWQSQIDTPQTTVFRQIIEGMLPEDVADIEILSALLVDGIEAQRYLQDHAEFYAAQIAALYAARNLHLHNGVHDVPGEVCLSFTGQLVVDAIVEIWALWLSATGGPTPRETITLLSDRFEKVSKLLAAGKPMEGLNPGSLAAPSWKHT
jgi:hypothetical protein